MKCQDTGLIFLDKNVMNQYNSGIAYWGKNSIQECRKRTLEYDERRSKICLEFIKLSKGILNYFIS